MSAYRADERRSHRPGAAGRVHVRRPALRRVCRRHAGLGAARERRPRVRPLLQVSPPARAARRRFRGAECARDRSCGMPGDARRTCARRRSRSTRDSSPRARTAGPRSVSTCMAVNDVLAPLFPAAFYYKTFMWPRSAWHRWYEPAIRRAAGLGRAPSAPDPDRYAQRFAHCDVLVVGAGPAGLAAALAAAATGARVMLCDEQPEPGGSLLDEHAATIDGQPRKQWLSDPLAALCARPNVTLLTRTTAFGYFPHNLIGLCERLTDHRPAPAAGTPRERLWQVRAREVVLATGAVERPLVFPGNDRPGRHARVCGIDVPASLRRQRRLAHRRRDRLRCGLRDRARPACGGRDDCAHRRRARRLRMVPGPRLRVRPVSRSSTGRPSSARRAGWASAASTLGTIADGNDRRPAHDRLRCAADVRRPHPERAPVLAVARQAGLGCRAHGVPAGAIRRTGALGGSVSRHRRPRDGAQRRRRGRAGRSPRRRSRRRAAADACCVT